MNSEDSISKNKIDPAYVRLLKSKINQTFAGITQKQIADILGFGPTTFHNLINNNKGVIRTVNEIARGCEFYTYDEFLDKKPILNLIKKRLLEDDGIWVSYCFDRRRRLYESLWRFKETQRPQTNESFIEVTRDSSEFQYKGELTLDLDLSLTVSTLYNSSHKIEYKTAFPTKKNESFYREFQFLNLEAFVSRRKLFFSTLEVLIKLPNTSNITPKKIQYAIIKAQMGLDGIPNNYTYLAFNFLTRNVSKSRRLIDNFSINEKKENGSYLNYKHDIFISCPVGYIENKVEFDAIKDSVSQIIKVLEDKYGFKKKNIHCEIIKYKDFESVQRDDRHLFFESRKYIDSTHYLALVPKNLGRHSSGMYMEIYFRILRKLPAIIFMEDRHFLPSLLHGLSESPDRPINITFKDYEISKVANYINADVTTEYLFQFSL